MTDTTPVQPAVALRPPSGVEYVFEARASTLPDLREYFAEVWRRRHFAVALAKADLRGGRSGTFLGELWSVLDPILQAAIYYLLITMIRGGRGAMLGDENVERLTLLVSGVFLFGLTSSILGEGARSLRRNKGLMLNSTFPRILLPIASTYKAVLDFVPVACIYALFHLVIGGPVGVGIFMLPLLFLLQVVLSLGLGLIFATLVVFIPDMSNVLEYIMRLLFFASPVLYPVASLSPSLVSVLRFNPLFAMFAAYQEIIAGRVPGVGLVLQLAFWAALALAVGVTAFVSNERGFALRL